MAQRKDGSSKPIELEHVSTVADFAAALKELRWRAGEPSLATIRARTAGLVPRSSASEFFNAKRLPREDQLRALLEVLGVSDGKEAQRWVDVCAAIMRAAAKAAADPAEASGADRAEAPSGQAGREHVPGLLGERVEAVAQILWEARTEAAAHPVSHLLLATRILHALDPDDLQGLTVRHGLAKWAGADKKTAKRERRALHNVFTGLVEDYRRILGDEHPDTLLVRNELLPWIGDRNASFAARIEVIKDYRRVLGDEHPDTLARRADLFYYQLHSDDQLLADCLRVLGDDHPTTKRVRAIRNSRENTHYYGMGGI